MEANLQKKKTSFIFQSCSLLVLSCYFISRPQETLESAFCVFVVFFVVFRRHSSLCTQLLLEFTSDLHQTWYVCSPKPEDDPPEKGSRSGVILG